MIMETCSFPAPTGNKIFALWIDEVTWLMIAKMPIRWRRRRVGDTLRSEIRLLNPLHQHPLDLHRHTSTLRHHQTQNPGLLPRLTICFVPRMARKPTGGTGGSVGYFWPSCQGPVY